MANDKTFLAMRRPARRANLVLCALITLSTSQFARAADLSDPVTVSITPTQALIQNASVRVTYDLHLRKYRIDDLVHHVPALINGKSRIDEFDTSDASFSSSASSHAIHDSFGDGKTLRIQSDRQASPSLLLDLTLYPNRSFVALSQGMINKTDSAVRIREFHPLTEGQLFPGPPWSDAQTLDGMSATHQTHVNTGPILSSANDLLLTFRQANQRRSVVLGALATSDFTKWIHTQSGDKAGQVTDRIAAGLPGAKLVSYLDCGRIDASSSAGPALRTVAGETFSFPADAAHSSYSDVLYEPKEARLEATGLDPQKRYALAWVWWDYDANGRVESVHVRSGSEDRELLPPQPLPAFLSKNEPPSEIARVIPADMYRSGTVEIIFKNESSAPNAVVSAVWLWELPAGVQPSADLIRGRAISAKADDHEQLSSVTADLQAFDPVGRLVSAGETYLPGDSFYIDVANEDPFTAMENYGHALAQATHANPNLYDFPTVCAWYAGVWHTPGAQDHPEKSQYQINTTAGLVEEMHKVRDRGFLNYSRVAMRLVPDTYQLNNPQGWWDDAHWQKSGYYVSPYETSRQFGHAIQQLGGLAFTYFQPECIWLSLKFGSNSAALSRDFRNSHADLLIQDDPNRSLDYTKPQTQAYMRNVFAAMRGAISGIMFDYCDDFWMADASRGGFADPHATATSYYRTLFRLAKNGLGAQSWIHERNLGRPDNDLTLGYVDLQRTSNDTDKITPDMVSRSGLRWYKNRVVISYDMDSKDIHGSWKVPGVSGSDVDGRRMMLTMEYVAGSRLLLANSFRDLSAEELFDVERVVPFPAEHRSARPIDAFISSGWPRVYDYAINRQWHQLTLYNNALPTAEQIIHVPLSGDTVDGALGLDPAREYFFYDFWNDHFVGRLRGDENLSQTLRPGEARMLSIHEVEPNPQFLSTNRHLMQGYYDMVSTPTWDIVRRTLSGESRVVAGEPYKIILATNGYIAAVSSAGALRTEIETVDSTNGLIALVIHSPTNQIVKWKVQFK